MERGMKLWCLIAAAAFAAVLSSASAARAGEKIGVLLVLHGGMDEYRDQYLWDSSVQMFSYDPRHPVYQLVMWNPFMWSSVLQIEFGQKFIKKFEFEYERIGGRDPFQDLSNLQLEDMKAALDNNTHGLSFEVDYAAWMSGDRPEHYAYPRFIYNVPPLLSGVRPLLGFSRCGYCGEREEGGPWPGCDPARYNVDGPVERLLDKGVSRIIAVDLTVGGVRFYKTYDVLQMGKRALTQWNKENGTSVPLLWINDYGNLMEESYPAEPAGWTPTQGPPELDRQVLINGRPNPLAADPEIALLQVEGLEAGFSAAVPDNQTAVVLLNHGLFDPDRAYFDPKIDDTIVLNKNIKALLLERHPDMDADNVIGVWGGIKEKDRESGLVERTREMRGEDLAHCYLHETAQDMPGDEWGYRYWDGLDYLLQRGVRHIVVGFPQVITDSVLTLVESYNMIGKEIGVKSWLGYTGGNFAVYPGVGHPFADYWGNWVDTECDGEACCFEMGGCADGRPYPPPRQAPLNKKRDDMDPSLAYDLSDFGHLGYDPSLGPPDKDRPVQNQYTGTWESYVPPSSDPRVGRILAKHVLNAAVKPLVYITNGETAAVKAGRKVTWQANLAAAGSGNCSYAWFYKKQGASDWQPAGSSSAVWEWTPSADQAGVYSILCRVTDAGRQTAEGSWDGFVVSAQ